MFSRVRNGRFGIFAVAALIAGAGACVDDELDEVADDEPVETLEDVVAPPPVSDNPTEEDTKALAEQIGAWRVRTSTALYRNVGCVVIRSHSYYYPGNGHMLSRFTCYTANNVALAWPRLDVWATPTPQPFHTGFKVHLTQLRFEVNGVHKTLPNNHPQKIGIGDHITKGEYVRGPERAMAEELRYIRAHAPKKRVVDKGDCAFAALEWVAQGVFLTVAVVAIGATTDNPVLTRLAAGAELALMASASRNVVKDCTPK